MDGETAAQPKRAPRMEDWFSNARRRRDNVSHWLAPVLGNRLYL